MITIGDELYKIFWFAYMSDKSITLRLNRNQSELLLFRTWTKSEPICFKRKTIEDFLAFSDGIARKCTSKAHPTMESAIVHLESIFPNQSLVFDVDAELYNQSGPQMKPFCPRKGDYITCVVKTEERPNFEWEKEMLEILEEKAFGGFRYPPFKMQKFSD